MIEGIAAPAAGPKGFITGAINGSSIIFRAGVTAPKLAITGSKGTFIGDVKSTEAFTTGNTIASIGDGPIKRYLVTDWAVTGYISKIIITNVIPKIHLFP
jgi:hypothetical protein